MSPILVRGVHRKVATALEIYHILEFVAMNMRPIFFRKEPASLQRQCIAVVVK